MEESEAGRMPWITWGVATRMLAGQTSAGDQYLVAPLPTGVLIAVVDGLGHGEEAEAVAKTAVATLQEYACESVTHLIRQCHEALQGTRGVVMSLAAINAGSSLMTWAGVGDVEGVLSRAHGTRE